MSKQTDLINIPDAITVSGSNVGIGTSSPSQKLHVEGAGNQFILLNNSTTNDGFYFKAGAGASSIQTNGGSNVMNFFTSGNERMRIDSSGRVTTPNQPAFLVRPSGYQLNIQNLATTLVAFGNETFDRGNNFSNSIYTAPVTGVYQFNFGLRIQSVDTAATYYQTTLNTSNSYFEHLFSPKLTSDMQYWTVQVSVLADMDAGDTAKVEILQAFGDGAMDIHSASHFSGYLVA
jgi:hypothetical protein